MGSQICNANTTFNFGLASGSASKLLLPKTTSKQQVNDMPNDQTHSQIYEHAKSLCAKNNLIEAQKIADSFFQKGYIIEAIETYQRIISTNPNHNCDIEGLGSHLLADSFYEWNVFQWYNKKRLEKKIKSSHYDALSLCFMLLMDQQKYSHEMKKGLMWYQSMLSKNPKNVGLTMGYANLLGCTRSFDQAVKHYDRVIQLKADLVNAYTNKAMIYEFKRINHEKAKELALKVNEMSSSNPYADFILALNVEDIDEKISKLKQVNIKHSEYVKVINQIGNCYGGTKQKLDQGIEWYKKCIEIAPLFYSCYNNIGVNYQVKKDYQEARKWYYKAMEIKSDNYGPYKNISDVYMKLNWTNEQIEEQVMKYDKVNFGYFCSNLGVAFSNKNPPQIQRGIYWKKKSVQLCPQNSIFWMRLGVSFSANNQYEKAIQTYKHSIELDPQNYIAYFNIALTYQKLNQLQKVEEYYKKALEINPKYSDAWYNLAVIYKDKEQYQQAIQYYQHAIDYNSTDTLALCSYGMCLLKLGKYKEAVQKFSRAKIALPNDNNKLSQGHKNFLKKKLDIFEQEGKKWEKKSGPITKQEKQSLDKLIQQFQNKFNNNTTVDNKYEVPSEKIMKKQILSIIKIIKQDQFELEKIDEIFQHILTIFPDDKEYFHIIPLLVIKKFTTSVFEKNKDFMDVENELREVMEKIAKKVSDKQFPQGWKSVLEKLAKKPEIKLTESQIFNKDDVDLFKGTAYFISANQLYNKVNKVDTEAKKSYTNFSELFVETRIKSNGISSGGILTKIPAKKSEQFKVMLRITEKLFNKEEINDYRKIKIITQINDKLKKLQTQSPEAVVKEIVKTWNNQITQILEQRQKRGQQTQFTISDLLRARLMYEQVDDLIKAVRVVDSYCKKFSYDVLELENRLKKRQTQDVVFKIKIGDAICQLQLAMKQNETYTNLDHCVYEILRSPLGVIFGSYLFMSKQVKYPLAMNCRDIVEKLKETKNEEEKLIKACAQYVLEALQTVNGKK